MPSVLSVVGRQTDRQTDRPIRRSHTKPIVTDTISRLPFVVRSCPDAVRATSAVSERVISHTHGKLSSVRFISSQGVQVRNGRPRVEIKRRTMSVE